MFNNEDSKMKLQELAVANPTKQAAKVFESYFGNTVKFDQLSPSQAQGMLKRVRGMIAEHRRTPEFHRSEQNPAYLKLVVMEQALATQVSGSAPQQTPQQQQAAMSLNRQQKQRELDDEEKQLTKQAQDITSRKAAIQKEKAMLEGRRSLKQRLKEASEVQQAQVVLASQDMVDQVQGMSEDISAMQFKDLPALVDQIKNEVGVDQAAQFNTDATAALSGLLQNLQAAKQQLETALGVVTGQAPVVPGADVTADAGLGGEMPAELPAPGEQEIDVTDVDIEEPEQEPVAGLGRQRR
jgi:hypothetical protein